MKTSYTKVSSDKLQVTDFKSKRSACLSTSQGGDRARLLDEQVHAAYSPVPQVGVSDYKVSYFNQSDRNVI
ncbi:MAG: hypothetical protein KAI95_05000, partial [Bacteroidales bacterium]|nr:hypothetical protein [Bacteroidales bacterium]